MATDRKEQLRMCQNQIRPSRYGAFILMLLVLTACSALDEPHPKYPSYEELRQHGYYVYTLPSEVLAKQNWVEEVWSVGGLGWDCTGFSQDKRNPLEVAYYAAPYDRTKNANAGYPQHSVLAIELGPWSPPWAYDLDTSHEVKLTSPWVDGGTAWYTEFSDKGSDTSVGMRFTDKFKLPVYVFAELPLTDVVSLVDQLEYVGPSPDSITNPWNCAGK